MRTPFEAHGQLSNQRFHDLVSMKFTVIILLASFSICSCKPIQENILGTYDLDVERGCGDCEEDGPKVMVFEDTDISDGVPGHYRFEFSNGDAHSGEYDFLWVDTAAKLMLYPDSASFELYGLIGTTQQTDYRVQREKIKETCDGFLQNCIWRRRD